MYTFTHLDLSGAAGGHRGPATACPRGGGGAAPCRRLAAAGAPRPSEWPVGARCDPARWGASARASGPACPSWPPTGPWPRSAPGERPGCRSWSLLVPFKVVLGHLDRLAEVVRLAALPDLAAPGALGVVQRLVLVPLEGHHLYRRVRHVAGQQQLDHGHFSPFMRSVLTKSARAARSLVSQRSHELTWTPCSRR